MQKGDFFNWLATSRHLSRGSLRTTEIKWNFVQKWLSGRRLKHGLVEDFILSLRTRGCKNSTINGYIRVFALLDAYHKARGVSSEYVKGIEYFPKTTHVPTILSIEEIESIINSKIIRCQSQGMSPERNLYLNRMSRLAVWFLAATGCRINEMASLTKERLYLGMLNYAQFTDTKTYLDRRVPLPPLLASDLSDWVKDKSPKDLVFTSSLGNKLVEQTFNPILREKVQNAGVNKHVYAHCFRNSYIMEHLKCGTDVLTIAKLVGHSDVNTTMGYTKFNYEMIEKGAENHPLFARTLTTQKVVQKIAQTVETWPVLTDRRFSFRKEIRENSILIEIYTN